MGLVGTAVNVLCSVLFDFGELVWIGLVFGDRASA